MSDILIDLGEQWNHIIPLSTLMNITHIAVADSFITIECTIVNGGDVRVVDYKSALRFSAKDIQLEKNRLLGLSNGIINNKDMKSIIASMEAQTGLKIKEVIDKPSYDIHTIRKIWAELNNEPYFRYILQYNPVDENIQVVEEHNDIFANNTLGEWMDEHTMRVVTNLDDRLLLFAFNAIDSIAEPIRPLADEDEFLDPNADIPVMGDATQGLATQQVDLSQSQNTNNGPDGNVMMRT
jgi:hypothetical protein